MKNFQSCLQCLCWPVRYPGCVLALNLFKLIVPWDFFFPLPFHSVPLQGGSPCSPPSWTETVVDTLTLYGSCYYVSGRTDSCCHLLTGIRGTQTFLCFSNSIKSLPSGVAHHFWLCPPSEFGNTYLKAGITGAASVRYHTSPAHLCKGWDLLFAVKSPYSHQRIIQGLVWV